MSKDWQSILRPDEQLLWEGRPDGGIRFRSIDVLLIPLSLIWVGLGFVIPIGAGGTFAILAAFMFLTGLYYTIGRFFHDAYNRSHTRYALTDRRALIETGIRSKNLQSIPLEKSTRISVLPGKRSTIDFTGQSGHLIDQVKQIFQSIINNQNSFDGNPYAAFDYIADGPKVYAIIQDVQEQSTP